MYFIIVTFCKYTTFLKCCCWLKTALNFSILLKMGMMRGYLNSVQSCALSLDIINNIAEIDQRKVLRKLNMLIYIHWWCFSTQVHSHTAQKSQGGGQGGCWAYKAWDYDHDPGELVVRFTWLEKDCGIGKYMKKQVSFHIWCKLFLTLTWVFWVSGIMLHFI